MTTYLWPVHIKIQTILASFDHCIWSKIVLLNASASLPCGIVITTPRLTLHRILFGIFFEQIFIIVKNLILLTLNLSSFNGGFAYGIPVYASYFPPSSPFKSRPKRHPSWMQIRGLSGTFSSASHSPMAHAMSGAIPTAAVTDKSNHAGYIVAFEGQSIDYGNCSSAVLVIWIEGIADGLDHGSTSSRR